MFSKAFQRKYALTDQGLKNTKSGAFWTVVTNLVVMGGMGILYLLMGGFMGTLTDGAPLPGAALPAVLTVGFVLLSFVTHLQQYRATYGLVYGEVKTTRLRLAERLRKLPLGYFGKRDLADLTETIMGDVNRMEHVWSHVLGYLYGAYISTAIIALCLLFYDWRLMIACLWGVPVAFGLLFGSRKIAAQNSEVTKKAALRVSDGIQEALENVREIRAANQEERYLAGLYEKIDQHEKVTIRGELTTGLFVNAASVIMRLGVATTILTGASLVLSGQIDFMVLFLFLLVITRVYAPFDQSLALIAEMFISQVSADRINEIYETPIAKGAETFRPQGHDIIFDHVGFAYDKKQVLRDVSFTAKECSATRFLRNRDRIVEKKSPILRSISEARSLASTAPPTRGAAHARGRAFLGSGRSGFCRPSLCLLPSCGGLPFRLLVRAFCGLLGPFLGLHGLGVLRPAIDAGLPYVPVDVGRPLLAVVGNLRALAVCVMRPEGLHPVGELLERVADLCPHGGRLRGFSVLPGVGDVMDGAVELPLVLDDVARLAPPILIPGDKELGIFCDGGVVELLGLGRFDKHELGDGLGGLTPLLSVRDGLDGLLRC